MPENPKLSGFLRGLTRVNNVLSSVQMVLAILLLIVFVALSSGEVFFRYVLSASMTWSPEIATMALVWSVFLASAICFRHGEHLIVDVFTPRTTRSKMVNAWIVGIVNLAYLIAVAYYAYLALPGGMSSGTPMLGVPLAIGYTSLLVMGLTGSVYVIETLLRTLVEESLDDDLLEGADVKASEEG